MNTQEALTTHTDKTTDYSIDYQDENRVITVRSTVIVCMLWLIVVVGLARMPRADQAWPPFSPTTLRINPNKAEQWELSTLPSIGDTRASAIIDYRHTHTTDTDLEHPAPVFAGADDLQQVRGIGPKTVSKLKPYLRFDKARH